VPDYFHKDLYSEFLRERIVFRRINNGLLIFGYGCLVAYLILLWGFGVRDPKFILLDVIGIAGRLSVIVVFKIYEIPNVCLELISEVPSRAILGAKTIEKYRQPILSCLFENLYGKNFNPQLIHMDTDELRGRIIRLERYNWKLWGTVYLVGYATLSFGLILFVLV
jgi:hypothetical protein